MADRAVTVTHSCGHVESHDLSARPVGERSGFARLMGWLPCGACIDRDSRRCSHPEGRERREGRDDRRECLAFCDTGEGRDLLFDPGRGCDRGLSRSGWDAELRAAFARSGPGDRLMVSPAYDFGRAFTDGLTVMQALEESTGRLALPGAVHRFSAPVGR